METTLHEPEITAKKGRLKSRRKSRKENIKTSDDLATLENLDEVEIQQIFLLITINNILLFKCFKFIFYFQKT